MKDKVFSIAFHNYISNGVDFYFASIILYFMTNEGVSVARLIPIDFHGCKNIPTQKTVGSFLQNAEAILVQAGATIREKGWNLQHAFVPHGLTIVFILGESNMTIHTYPEHRGITLTLETCGKNVDADHIIASLEEIFKPEKSTRRRTIKRRI